MSKGMRYRKVGSWAWVYCRYSVTGMATAILNEYEYQLEGRDYTLPWATEKEDTESPSFTQLLSGH